MERVIADLVGCSGTEPPYVMVSRATSLDGLIVLRDFDPRQITKRRSEESRNEFSRLMRLKWETILKCGNAEELEEARCKLSDLGAKGKKRKADSGKERPAPSKKTKVSTSA